jgi:aminocarboxymuconate-semialdehyde decarboxylase
VARGLAKDGAREGATLERAGDRYTIRTNRIVNAFSDEFVDIGLRLAGMDRQRVDVHAMSLTAPMVYWASPAFGLALSQAYNDAASAAHLKHPKRLFGLAMAAHAGSGPRVEGARSAPRAAGIRGMYLATHVNDENLDDSASGTCTPRRGARAGPSSCTPSRRSPRERTARVLPEEPARQSVRHRVSPRRPLIFGGVLDAFPKLEVNLPHAGGTFPWLIGRLDHGTKVRPELKHMKRLPSEYLRRFTYDIIGHNDAINSNSRAWSAPTGWCSAATTASTWDRPIPSAIGRAARHARRRADRHLIIGDTPAKLLGSI